MEQTNTLQTLVEKDNELKLKVKEMNSNLEQRLNTLFTAINSTGLELLPIKVGVEAHPWVSMDLRDKIEEQTFSVRTTIYFKNLDPNKDRDYDFGSNFDLTIYDTFIEINKGTCGSYTKYDRCQKGRDLLLASVWENEQTLCDICKEVINVELLDELYNVRKEIQDINYMIVRAKEEAELKVAKKELLTAKFLAKKRKDEHYNWDTHSYDEPTYTYHTFQKIVKITDKLVIVQDCNNDGEPWYVGDTRRLKLSQVLNNIKSKYLFCLQNTKEEAHAS